MLDNYQATDCSEVSQLEEFSIRDKRILKNYRILCASFAIVKDCQEIFWDDRGFSGGILQYLEHFSGNLEALQDVVNFAIIENFIDEVGGNRGFQVTKDRFYGNFVKIATRFRRTIARNNRLPIGRSNLRWKLIGAVGSRVNCRSYHEHASFSHLRPILDIISRRSQEERQRNQASRLLWTRSSPMKVQRRLTTFLTNYYLRITFPFLLLSTSALPSFFVYCNVCGSETVYFVSWKWKMVKKLDAYSACNSIYESTNIRRLGNIFLFLYRNVCGSKHVPFLFHRFSHVWEFAISKDRRWRG